MRTREAGTGERLAPHDLLRQSELLADGAHLVLEQQPQRLDQLEVHVVGQSADVVVALDGRGVVVAGLDDVGIQRALHEEPGVAAVGRGLLEHADEQLADRLALGLGVDDVVERLHEAVAGLHVDELDVELVAEGLLDLLGLAVTHEPGVDEHAGELVADRLVHERGGDRRVDATGQAAEHPRVADLRADRRDLLLDHRRRRPLRAQPGARRTGSRFRISWPRVGVHDLGVELHAADAPLGALERRRPARPVSTRSPRSPAGAVTIESKWLIHTSCAVGQVAEQQPTSPSPTAPCGRTRRCRCWRRRRRVADRSAALRNRCRRSARRCRRPRVEPRRALDVHRLGPARQDDRRRRACCDLLGGDRVRDDLGVHVRLAHAPGDQLRVLRAEVDDENSGAVAQVFSDAESMKLLPSVSTRSAKLMPSSA